MGQGWRQPVLKAARRHGIEPQLRKMQRALMSKEERRNTTDMDHLCLAIALSLAPDACCIDIGANVGQILEQLVAMAPDGHHIAFEPLPELAGALARRFPTVDVRCAAVAESAGTRTFTRVLDAHTRSGFHEDGYDGPTENFDVDVQVIDDVVADDRPIDLIKIDVEGAELEVLQGARRTLERCKPAIAVEHGGPPTVSRALYELLCDDIGLRLFDMDGAGPLSREQFLAAVASGSHWNFLAHR